METNLVLPDSTKRMVAQVQEQASAYNIETPDDAEAAAALLTQIKDAETALVTRKEEITRPLMRSLASIRDLFKPLELTLADAKKMVRAKVGAYQIAVEATEEAARLRIAGKVEKGLMRPDTAAAKLGELEKPKKIKGIQMRKIQKIRIMDETMIPREYLVPDMAKITEAVLRQGIDVAGVEKYEEKIVASV